MSQTSPIETSTGSGSRTSTEGWRSPMPAVPFLTVREAAELLRVSPTRVRHLIYFRPSEGGESGAPLVAAQGRNAPLSRSEEATPC